MVLRQINENRSILKITTKSIRLKIKITNNTVGWWQPTDSFMLEKWTGLSLSHTSDYLPLPSLPTTMIQPKTDFLIFYINLIFMSYFQWSNPSIHAPHSVPLASLEAPEPHGADHRRAGVHRPPLGGGFRAPVERHLQQVPQEKLWREAVPALCWCGDNGTIKALKFTRNILDGILQDTYIS